MTAEPGGTLASAATVASLSSTAINTCTVFAALSGGNAASTSTASVAASVGNAESTSTAAAAVSFGKAVRTAAVAAVVALSKPRESACSIASAEAVGSGVGGRAVGAAVVPRASFGEQQT